MGSALGTVGETGLHAHKQRDSHPPLPAPTASNDDVASTNNWRMAPSVYEGSNIISLQPAVCSLLMLVTQLTKGLERCKASQAVLHSANGLSDK